MASSSHACMVSPGSWLRKKMKITEDMLMSCGPTAESDTLLPPPFPLASDQDLALNVNTRELHSTKRSLVFPRYFKEWNDLVNKTKGTYSTAWERMGIAGLVYLSVHEITMVATVLEGALNFWSSHCNSLILPLGPMSITLRDAVAITGLPIFGDEVPSWVTCDAFPNVTGKRSRNYAAMITNLANKEIFTVDDHLVFVWILLSQWVFEPVGCSPTLEVLVIAKALVTGQKLALGTMLLANTYRRLSIVVTNQPFSKLKGGLWLLQLWLFAYFPHLSTGNYWPESQFLGIDMCYRSSNLSLKEVLRYFRTRIPSSLNDLLICSTRSDSYLPPCARTFSHAASKEDRQWWKMFCLTRKLHHGTSRARSSRISTTGMVLYAPCLWARQFGLFQGIPGPVPFPSSQERHGADEDDITAALTEAETGVERSNGIIFLHPDYPSFDSWWSIVFNSCMPPTDASGSSEEDLRTPRPVFTIFPNPEDQITKVTSGGPIYDMNTRRSGRNHRVGLGFYNDDTNPIDLTEDEPAPQGNGTKMSPKTLIKKEKMLIDIPVIYARVSEQCEDEEEVESDERAEEVVNEGEGIEGADPGIREMENEPSESSFLVYDDGGAYEDAKRRENEDVGIIRVSSLSDINTLSTSPTFTFSSIAADSSLLQPPARTLLQSSSSLNILLNSHPSQESCLTDVRLDPVELQVENPFDNMDFSFMTEPAPRRL